MYVRNIRERELTFGVSGRLWRENLIMYDRQTDSWWAQAYGRAIQGPMKGAELEMYPTAMMTWKQWRELHPETLALSKRVRGRLEGMSDAYAGYHRSQQIGVTGLLRFRSDGIGPKARVLSFVVDGASFTVPLAELSDNPVLTAEAGGRSFLIVGTPDKKSAKVFISESSDWALSEAGEGTIVIKDGLTDSEWDGLTGNAVAGPAKGQQLAEVPGTLSYWFAWKTFYPQTTILKH